MALYRGIILRQGLDGIPNNKKALFALLCAERLQACCWAFSMKEKWDLGVYYQGCDLAFKHLSTVIVAEPCELDDLIDKLESSVPSSDDFGYPLAVQAQSGMLALLYCLETLRTDDPFNAVNAASAVIDGLDNYEYFIHKLLMGAVESPSSYMLLDREIQWQEESLSILKSEPLESIAVALRIRNRSYAVPIAVPLSE